MSQENVELTHGAVDAFNRSDLDAFLALMDDDVEVLSALVPMEGGFHGHDGVRRWLESLRAVRPDYTIQVVERVTVGT